MNFLNGTKRMDSELTQEVRTMKAQLDKLGRAFELSKESRELDSYAMCSVIRQCGESGVYEAKIGDLELKLAPKKEVFEKVPEKEQDGLEPVNEEQYRESEKELAKQEQLLKQATLDELEITNPSLYEELLLNEELIDAEETQDQ